MSWPETEILVHVTAPARAADDARYRALAAAYLSFEPATRTSVGLGLGAARGTGSEDVDAGGSHPGSVPTSTPEPGVIESPLLSFRSVINNLGSPRPRPQQGAQDNLAESQSSWRPPPSVIQDSMPDNDLVFAQYCTPTRILEHYTFTCGSTQPVVSPSSQRKRRQTPPVSSPHEKRRGQPCENEDDGDKRNQREGSGTVIPLSPAAESSRHPPAGPTPTAVVEETRIASSYPSQHGDGRGHPSRAESAPPLSKRPRTFRDRQPGKPLARSASDMGPRKVTANAPALILDSLEILSPPPVTTRKELRPEDMVTDVLASLARELNLEKRFRPESQTRDLRPFERGYWLVDCASWEPDLKRSAWAFLSDYLGKGAAGWGTCCRRDRAFSRIRLYCWGCVVGHMYLVLYLMSKRSVLYTGTSWIGADGKPVIVMGVRQAPA